MNRVAELKAELKKCRKELEFIQGQLENERMLETGDLADLTLNDIDRLELQNEKLITEIVFLETLLESL